MTPLKPTKPQASNPQSSSSNGGSVSGSPSQPNSGSRDDAAPPAHVAVPPFSASDAPLPISFGQSGAALLPVAPSGVGPSGVGLLGVGLLGAQSVGGASVPGLGVIGPSFPTAGVVGQKRTADSRDERSEKIARLEGEVRRLTADNETLRQQLPDLVQQTLQQQLPILLEQALQPLQQQLQVLHQTVHGLEQQLALQANQAGAQLVFHGQPVLAAQPVHQLDILPLQLHGVGVAMGIGIPGQVPHVQNVLMGHQALPEQPGAPAHAAGQPFNPFGPGPQPPAAQPADQVDILAGLPALNLPAPGLAIADGVQPQALAAQFDQLGLQLPVGVVVQDDQQGFGTPPAQIQPNNFLQLPGEDQPQQLSPAVPPQTPSNPNS